MSGSLPARAARRVVATTLGHPPGLFAPQSEDAQRTPTLVPAAAAVPPMRPSFADLVVRVGLDGERSR